MTSILNLDTREERQYLAILTELLRVSRLTNDRTGVGTYAMFGHMMRFNLAKSFPLLTTKKIFLKGVIHELIWFLSGDTNIKYLQDNGVRIWDEWARAPDGDIGPGYGKQWRAWPTGNSLHGHPTSIDQISKVVHDIKTNPNSRRHIVSAWNVAQIAEMALPPCHMLFQFNVDDGKLSCMVSCRSIDSFLGLPFNIASYALLTMMMAQVTGLRVGELIVSIGNLHLYTSHIDQAALQITREPRPFPTMKLNPDITDIFAFKYEDFTLEGYDPHPKIDAPVAV